MGKQIIQTPNGKYAIFSTVIDDFVAFNGTKEEVLEYFKAEAAKKAERDILEVFEKMKNGEKPYRQFTMSLEEMMEVMKKSHCEEDYETCKKELGLG